MAVTVTYEHPVTGIVAPTALQTKEQVTATVIATLDADAAAIIVHNMGLTAAELALGLPIVVLEPILAAARTSDWIVGSAALPAGKDANTIQVSKTIAGGSGNGAAQLRVNILRPHTIGR